LSLFSVALYDDLTQEQRGFFTDHLRECSQCDQEFSRMRTTIETLANPPRPDLDQNYWDTFWNRLENRVQEPITKPRAVEWWRRLVPNFRFEVRWAYQIVAVAAILLIGIFIGQNYFGKKNGYTENYTNLDTVIPIPMNDVSLTKRTLSYFERSEIILLGLVNFEPETDDPDAIDFPRQKRMSRELITEAVVLKEQLASPQQLRLRALITELEVILLQIANLENEYDLEAVELIQSSAERKGVLFKIRIEELLSGSEDGRFL